MRFIVVVYFLLLPTFLFASSFEEAFEAHQNKAYKKTYNIWLEEAEKGEVRSMHHLAWYYYRNGHGGHLDLSKAKFWYKKASEYGYIPSQLELGDMLQNEQPKKALIWYRRAAKQGESEAMFYIGLMYENGKGVHRDYNQAVKWFQKAIKAGGRHAKGYVVYELSGETNAVLELNKLKSIFEYEIKAKSGDEHARMRVISFYVETGNNDKALNWLNVMVKEGSKSGQYRLAQYYNYGTIMEHDYQKALALYHKASEQGQQYAKKDLQKLQNFLELKKKVEQEKNPINEYQLGWQYFMWHDYKRAFVMFEKSAKQGYADAEYRLGTFYEDGQGTHKDYKQAKYWLQRAEKQGVADAKLSLMHINYLLSKEKVRSK